MKSPLSIGRPEQWSSIFKASARAARTLTVSDFFSPSPPAAPPPAPPARRPAPRPSEPASETTDAADPLPIYSGDTVTLLVPGPDGALRSEPGSTYIVRA